MIIEDVVKNSIIDGRNIAQPTVDFRTGEQYVTWYNWSENFGKYFRSLPGILKYHHFRTDASVPGTVFAREYEDSKEIEHKIVLDDDLPDSIHELPPIITPPGMSVVRKQYLFDHIRQYCPTEEAANLTCPALATDEGPSTKRRKKEKSLPAKQGKASKSKRKCSHCREIGHTKTVRGKVTCPKLLQ